LSRSERKDGLPATHKRVGVISLGCPKNLVDTEVMLGHLDGAGYEFVQDPQEADMILINTCSFIESAREESVQTILEAAKLKQTGKLKRLVVAGCLTQRYRKDLAREMPEVDAFIGLDELDRIVETSPPPASSLRMAPTELPQRAAYLYDHTTPRRIATPPWTAYVKIAEGCDHTCSFCAIPSFRGKFRSRPIESILDEVETLTGKGVREINLLAQDSSHFGRDRGQAEGLASLLSQLNKVERLHWLRVHYLYPNTITDTLIETMAGAEKVVGYIDLPLQHAHNDTLKRMRRGGSAEGHLRLLAKFRAAMPDVTLRSTFIVGFPGETSTEFESLLAFIREARLDHLGVFTYSHEESTSAYSMQDDVPAEEKQLRHDRLMECQQEIAFEHARAAVGQQVEVLVEGAHPETEHLLTGRTRGQAPDVDGRVLINDGQADPGQFVQVELTETAGYDLVGRIVERE
jgi:ribosomal protein S12 methylthiotransferase